MNEVSAVEYQEFCRHTHDRTVRYFHEIALGVDYIVAEGGELANLVNKVRWQHHPITPELEAKMRLELSDVMWGLAVAAAGLGMTLEDVWNVNYAKLRHRYPTGEFSTEASIARVDTAEEQVG